MEVTKNKWLETLDPLHPRLCVRSDFKEESGQYNYLVAQFGWVSDTGFITRYVTLTAKELRELLGAKAKEKTIIKES